MLLAEILSLITPFRTLTTIFTSQALMATPLLGGILYTGCNSILWFFGIHGYYALLPFLEALNTFSVDQSIAVNENFLGVFAFIGGSGATFSLLLAILFFTNNRTLRILAVASISVGIFNVNEILLFGLPIIFNWRIFIPFLMVPIINLCIAYAAVSYGLFLPSNADLPFNSLILLNSYLNGGLGAVAVQLVCTSVGVLCYAPFVRTLAYGKSKDVFFPSLDTTFSRIYEEAGTLLDDPVAIKNEARDSYQQVTTELQRLSQREFFLQYQPLVNHDSGQVIGCEALLRVKNQKGEICFPDSFLPLFRQAGLMPSVDLWVLSTISKQILAWKKEGFHMPVSVNVTPESLHNTIFLKEVDHVLMMHPSCISFEITEHSPTGNIEKTRTVLEEFQQKGAKIYIDDFGTHYSSLSYIHCFPVDVIKIDRSFVLSLKYQRGQSVFAGILAFAMQLDLGIVVEGIDSDAQLAHLPKGKGIVIQGWYYSKSLDPEDLVTFVQERERKLKI